MVLEGLIFYYSSLVGFDLGIIFYYFPLITSLSYVFDWNRHQHKYRIITL